MGAWAIGGAGWWHAWGAQDDEESIATIRRGFELGINWVDTAPIYGLGHSEEVVGRALEGLDRAPVRLHQGLAARRRRQQRPPQPQARLAPARGRGEPHAPARRRHRPLPGPLARSPTRTSRRAGRRFAELKEQGLVAPHRRVELRRRADAPRAGHRAGRDAAAALLAARARRRGRDPALRRERGHRRDRLLADGVGAADRGDDRRADRSAARRRLAQARPALPGARALAPPRPRRAPAGGRRAPRHDRRARSRSRGRCTTRRWTARSSASAAPTRSSRWRSRATSSSTDDDLCHDLPAA